MKYLHVPEKAVAGVEQVSCELRHPGFVRLTGDARDLQGARRELEDEEDGVPDQAAEGR